MLDLHVFSGLALDFFNNLSFQIFVFQFFNIDLPKTGKKNVSEFLVLSDSK